MKRKSIYVLCAVIVEPSKPKNDDDNDAMRWWTAKAPEKFCFGKKFICRSFICLWKFIWIQFGRFQCIAPFLRKATTTTTTMASSPGEHCGLEIGMPGIIFKICLWRCPYFRKWAHIAEAIGTRFIKELLVTETYSTSLVIEYLRSYHKSLNLQLKKDLSALRRKDVRLEEDQSISYKTCSRPWKNLKLVNTECLINWQIEKWNCEQQHFYGIRTHTTP